MIQTTKQNHNVFIDSSKSTNRKTITELFNNGISTTDNYDEFNSCDIDLIIMDAQTASVNEALLRSHREKCAPLLVPLIVILEKNETLPRPGILNIADALLPMPVSKEVLKAQVEAMLTSRKNSSIIGEQQIKLEQKSAALNMYFNAIESATNGIIITDSHQNDNPIIFCNRAFKELTGYEQEEILGKNCRFLQNDDTGQKQLAKVREKIEKGESHQTLIRNYKKDGTLFWNNLTVSPLESKEGDVQFFVGIQNDITKQVRYQKELISARNQWQSIAAQSPNLIQISIDGVIKFINEAGMRIYEVTSSDQIIGTSIFDWIDPVYHAETESRLNDIRQGIELSPRIFGIKTRGNNVKYLRIQSIPIEYEGRDAAQTVGQDITEIIEIQKKLESSLEQKQILMQEVHHRVKNNLAVISGLIDLQLIDYEDGHSDKILKGIQSRILSIARVHELLYRQGNLNEIKYDKYIQNLVRNIKDLYDSESQEIIFNLSLSPLVLSLNQAVPCGLLLNELILSSLHSEVSQSGKKRIDLWIKTDDKTVDISYRFYGIGKGSSTEAEYIDNFGGIIIQTLLNQLDAEYRYSSDSGLEYSIQFTKRAHSSFLDN